MTKNVAASVRAKLATQARSSGQPFQEVLQYYGLERFLYRISQSQYRNRFLLKGALMLRVWETPSSRPTRDIDLLGYVDNELATLASIMQEVCAIAVEDDGLRFEPSTITAARIKEDADYEGVRIKFAGFLGTARIPMQIDIGFGDVVYPAAEERTYPTLLDLPAPFVRMYPRETVIAEKFQAMVHLGNLNSRMKDFFDIWLLARSYDFAGADLAKAIQETFRNRDTSIETDPVALTSAFTGQDTVRKQWAGFLKRSNLHGGPATLDEIRVPLRVFLLPVADALAAKRPFIARWIAPGPWQ